MNRHLFEVYYQEKFLNDKRNFYKQHLREYPLYSLEGRLKWDVDRRRYLNRETQEAWEWFNKGGRGSLEN